MWWRQKQVCPPPTVSSHSPWGSLLPGPWDTRPCTSLTSCGTETRDHLSPALPANSSLKSFTENRKPTLWNFLLPNTFLPTVSPLLFLDTHLEVSTSVQNQQKNGEGLFYTEVWSQWWGRGGQSEEPREPDAEEFRASCLLSDKGGMADFNIFSSKFHSVWSSDQRAGTRDSSLAQQSHTDEWLMEYLSVSTARPPG